MKQLLKQRATIDFTVEGNELIKIQYIIDFAKSMGVVVSYKNLKSVSR